MNTELARKAAASELPVRTVRAGVKADIRICARSSRPQPASPPPRPVPPVLIEALSPPSPAVATVIDTPKPYRPRPASPQLGSPANPIHLGDWGMLHMWEATVNMRAALSGRDATLKGTGT
jgi:hypothetical protein